MFKKLLLIDFFRELMELLKAFGDQVWNSVLVPLNILKLIIYCRQKRKILRLKVLILKWKRWRYIQLIGIKLQSKLFNEQYLKYRLVRIINMKSHSCAMTGQEAAATQVRNYIQIFVPITSISFEFQVKKNEAFIETLCTEICRLKKKNFLVEQENQNLKLKAENVNI